MIVKLRSIKILYDKQLCCCSFYRNGVEVAEICVSADQAVVVSDVTPVLGF